MRCSLIALAFALSSACGYDFETEKDLFRCASDDDCLDGFVCAGHTSVDDKPVIYCVEKDEVEIAVWQETMPAYQSGCDAAWEFEWDAWMDFSDNETPPDPITLTALSSTRQDFDDAGGECVGEVSGFGEVRVMCRMPKGEEIANTAAMWVVLYDVGGDALTFQDQQAVVFTSAVVDADTRMAPAPDEVVRQHQFDQPLSDLERCQRAQNERVCLENRTSIACTGCTDTSCPPHFSCVAGSCAPNPES